MEFSVGATTATVFMALTEFKTAVTVAAPRALPVAKPLLLTEKGGRMGWRYKPAESYCPR
jgi:hypothetical protein